MSVPSSPLSHARRALCSAILLLPLWAGAQSLEQRATNAGIADGISTFVGLAAGAAEVNPLGPVMSLAVKPAVLRYASGLPESRRPAAYALAASVWSGAAANNVCVAVSILTAGGFAPACIVLGAAWGWTKWKETEDERIFWAEGCPMLRQYTQEPDLKCVYVPRGEREAVRLTADKGQSAAPAGLQQD